MFGKLFGDKTVKSDAKFVPKTPSGPKARRSSGGWGALRKAMAGSEGLTVLDLGPTSPGNINFLTSMGHSVFMADPLNDLASGDWVAEDGSVDVQRFLNESLDPAGRRFDIVLLWDTLDYLPEPLLQPLVDRLAEVTVPGGQLLALFQSSRTEESLHRRFHLTGEDGLDVQTGAGYTHLNVLQNRQVEQLFHEFASRKTVLARDNLRETLFTR